LRLYLLTITLLFLVFENRLCISFGGEKIDARFGEEILGAISGQGIEASLRAIETFNSQHDTQYHALELESKQLKYEAERAFEQYDQVDPKNRLVARELERRWNAKMLQAEEAQDRLKNVHADRQGYHAGGRISYPQPW
jgi:hypothetical protein